MPFFLNAGIDQPFSLWTLCEQKHWAATSGGADVLKPTKLKGRHSTLQTDISAGGSRWTVKLQVSFCYKHPFKQPIFPPLLRKTLGKTFFLTLSVPFLVCSVSSEAFECFAKIHTYNPMKASTHMLWSSVVCLFSAIVFCKLNALKIQKLTALRKYRLLGILIGQNCKDTKMHFKRHLIFSWLSNLWSYIWWYWVQH